MQHVLIILLVFLVGSAAGADPLRPENCHPNRPDCPRASTEPYPETGLWFDPSQPGSGFMFEVQRGTVAGYYYGYESEGDPVWYMISGQLELVESEEVAWRLQTEMLRFAGGNCIDCPYTEPGDPEITGEITVEFMTRNKARFSVDGQSMKPIQAYSYGSVADKIFPEEDYKIPRLNGHWTLYWIDRDLEQERGMVSTAITNFDVRLHNNFDRRPSGEITYLVITTYTLPEDVIAGNLFCEPDPEGSGVVCGITLAQPPNASKVFSMEPSDISDHYFSATAEDGDTIEGFRLNYN